MNRIQELIKELCPNGVEWKKLGEVCEIIAGGDVPNNTIKGAFFDDEHRYPIYSNGVGINSLYGFTDSYRIDKESVTISARGTIGWHCVRKPNFTPIVRLITLVPYDVIIAKYLDAVLNVVNIEGSKGGIPQLTIPNVRNLQIPLPPLPIQTEIVRILDKFVEQQEQLVKLIELRKKQYEYYREEMLTAKEGWKTVTIGDITSKLASGATPNGGEDSYKESGISLIRSQNVLDFNMSFVGLAHIDQTQADKLKNVEIKENDLLLNITGDSVARICKVDSSILPARVNQHVMIIRLNEGINSNFVLYYLINAKKYLLQAAESNGGSRKALTKKNVSDFELKLPSDTKQKEIADALDNFESSISALTSALELSKKRYEHYRDEMLRF